MASVESVVKLLLQKLADPLIQEAIFLYGVRDQIEWLEAEFTQMQCFLKDADAKQEGDERVKSWVRNVRDVAYYAEDVIDTFVFKIAPSRQRGRIRRYAFIFNEFIALHKVGLEIERIKNKIHMISESRLAYGIENIGQGAGTSSAGKSLREWRLTSPLVEEPDFVGFEKDLKELVARLTEGDRRCVVSVVGMGGLGKTTITKKVYNNTHVKTHFDSCAWISVSQEFGVRDLLQNIINCYMVLSEEELKKVEKMDVFQLRHKISKYLQKKRYLMVLDDIWTNEAWDVLKDALPDMKNGSRVMLTTRNKDVALHADARSTPYELRFLETNECWELFCRKTFPGQDTGCPQELKQLGREIVGKCHGLPLAIVVIGGLLSRKEAWEWENVRKSISYQLVEGQSRISSILFLSYKDLPYHLKPCFLYLGIFPDDYEFQATKLIQLWAAEGLLQQRGDEAVEEVGEDYLKELIQRSMIQLVKRSSSGGIKSCRIHDLLRDLSISEAKEDKFHQVHHENVDAPSTSTARRLAIYRNALTECTSLKSSTPRLRSVFIHTQVDERHYIEKPEKFLYQGFKLLRVLDLHGIAIKKLPSEINGLIHLRYLGCTNTWLKRLPSSMANLHNLQTLIVTTYQKVLNIPSIMMKMQQLRHLQVGLGSRRAYYGQGVIEQYQQFNGISNLQTLTWINAGEWMYDCFGKLTNLRKLGICLSEEKYHSIFYESIVKLECLESLVLLGCKFPSLVRFVHLPKLSKLRLFGKLEKLPEYTELPTNLTKLTLSHSSLEQDPLVTLEKLKNLRILRLLMHSYEGVRMDCSSGGFPRLESLHLEQLLQLRGWIVEEGAMPSLLHLRIRCCWQLTLPEGLQHMTTLKRLELWDMHLFDKSFFEGNKGKNGRDWYKIQHIPSIDITYRELS
ncbi:probable disease resistance protein At1g58602 [Magnolia sinica]|uniref:probable disease resistance protein At1g58602 n=1 Tax=Magnolia sinica TaxID=86752 RepID=UPI002658F839|nr:probable disease resistance protein At1g58602 [Magnolia sinica]